MSGRLGDYVMSVLCCLPPEPVAVSKADIAADVGGIGLEEALNRIRSRYGLYETDDGRVGLPQDTWERSSADGDAWWATHCE